MKPSQNSLFKADTRVRSVAENGILGLVHVYIQSHAVAEAMDKINDKYGEFVITPALMMGMDDTIIDRIAFGGVKELEELYLGDR
jgi:hypothetical protein